MPAPEITIATRDWDHVVPLRTGDIRSDRIRLNVLTRAVTPTVVNDPDLDGGEVSFSRHVLGAIHGDDRLIGLPVFVMRGFRQRCVLVRADSALHTLSDLAGRRVGLTGWPDSGNTWTRAAIRAAGVDLTGIEWFVGDLSEEAVDPRRLGDAPLPANVRPLREPLSLVSGLHSGEVDAILTPFMPPGFFDPGASTVRHLLADHREVERAYFAETGYVPGIHVIALRRELVQRHPWIVKEVTDLFERAKYQWWQRRQMLADTTPWLLAELEDVSASFDGDWMPYGREANRTMIEDFAVELHAQGIADRIVGCDALFPPDVLTVAASGGAA